MAIDISGLTPNPNNSNKAKGTGTSSLSSDKGARSNSSDTANTSHGDSVELSSQVQNLQALESKINQLPDVNAAKVAAIKAAIARGDYEIHPKTIASKILAFELGLK